MAGARAACYSVTHTSHVVISQALTPPPPHSLPSPPTPIRPFLCVPRRMTGLLQTVFYFGYTALACTALGLATGTIGTFAAGTFVRAIFTSIKLD